MYSIWNKPLFGLLILATGILILPAILNGEPQTLPLDGGLRENGRYRVWVFFTDKKPQVDQEKRILPEGMIRRRAKAIISSEKQAFYDTPVSRDYIHEMQQMGVKILHESRWLNAVSVTGSREQLAKLIELPWVERIQPVNRFRRPKEIERIEIFKSSGVDTSFYGYSFNQLDQLNIPQVHDLGYKGNGIRILVLDTGFDLSHSSFDQINVIDEYDFINGDNTTANENENEINNNQDRHGTIVLSVLAANFPGVLVGAAPEVEVLLGKTEDVSDEYIGEEDNFVAGLEWGEENGAHIMTASLGYIDWYSFDDLNGSTAITTRAVNVATELGMLCVVAAGNEGKNGIIAPADAFSVISVGAVLEDGRIASFSSVGPTADGRIKPELCARGYGTAAAIPGTSTGIGGYSGTSLATPLISGAAALAWRANQDLSNLELRSLLLENGNNTKDPDNTYGWGIPDILKTVQPDFYEFLETEQNILSVPNPLILGRDYGEIVIWYYLEDNHESQISIYDVLGRKLLEYDVNGEKGVNRTNLDVRTFSSGIYFAKIDAGTARGQKSQICKFTILR